MSDRGPHRRGWHFERVITRDERVPLSDDDREMDHSWRCIPVPPTADGDWLIIDGSSDRKTTWGRWRPNDGGAQ